MILRRATPPAAPQVHNDQAEQLTALVRECEIAGIARRACIVRLSRLGQDRVRPHHLRLAHAALEPLAHADRARLFTLPSQDIVAIWRGPAEAALAASRIAIMHLFLDEGDSLTTPSTLWQELALPEQASSLLALAGGTDEPRAMALPPAADPPLDPAALSALEAQLAQADIARFARRSQICVRQPDGRLRLRWEKRTLCVAELAESLAPAHAPQADPWLFRRLTRTLDRRMLALLAAPSELDEAGPFAIDLNISSILAPEFLRFDAALPAALRSQVSLDLDAADILADPAAFLFARDFAHARGYRLLLRDVTAALLPVFPPSKMGLDHVQLRWSAQTAALPAEALTGIASQIVLADTDTDAALAWGTIRGITLFQGRAALPARRRLDA